MFEIAITLFSEHLLNLEITRRRVRAPRTCRCTFSSQLSMIFRSTHQPSRTSGQECLDTASFGLQAPSLQTNDTDSCHRLT